MTRLSASTLANAYSNRGVIYDDLGQHLQAIEDYDDAIRLNPGYANAYYNRGNAYADLGQHLQAIEDYDDAIRLNPELVLAYINRGNAHNNLGQPQREKTSARYRYDLR